MCDFAFSSAARPFKSIFEEHGAKGFYRESEGENQYYRVLPAVIFEAKQQIIDLIGDLRVALRAVLDGAVSAAWIGALRGPFVHLV